ncbi:hypothetical protein C3391_10650 [Citrobacter freundii complex sp. CFNIH8]|nr:hypothetical protein C3391_10650 [Citrobacter freundii complex sp. CFNIH8]QBI31225.1 hypothetical protein WN16_19770 [Citrobacter sp. ABFQG]TBW45347.1 hypothetical protein EY699_08385 [Citrobacter freundii]
MLRRSSSSDRKLLLTCAITGIVVALLVSSLQFFMSWHQRNAKYAIHIFSLAATSLIFQA